MELKYARYDFTPILGWSISRYEIFDKCKRQYFYQYYSKFVRDIPLYKIRQLRELTSVPLEVGNVVHDVLEAFLRRLQKSDSDIDEERFYRYAEEKAREYFSTKTFLETRYGTVERIDMDAVYARIRRCLRNFMGSPVCTWIYMNALRNKSNWMIEPPGYGETRLNGLKAYCKMDFLFPLENEVAVVDWKTGKRDGYKHANQVIAYAAAASNNFGIPMERIYPRIVYLYPEYGELEVAVDESHLQQFYTRVREQTDEMHACCVDVEQNVPRDMEHFPMTPSRHVCAYCNYQELCFPERKRGAALPE